MAAPGAHAVLRGQAELAHVGAEHLRLDPGDRGGHLEQDVAPFVREHVGDERGPIERAVVGLVGRHAARAEPGVAAVVEVARHRAELAHHERFFASSLGVERPLEQLEPRPGIGEPGERSRRRRDHREDRAGRVVVRPDARERGGELEPRLVERGVHLCRALQVRDSLADLPERLDLELPERGQPARVHVPELGPPADDARERAGIADGVSAARRPEEGPEAGEGARVLRRLRHGLDERALRAVHVGQVRPQLGELEEDLALRGRVALGLREALEQVGDLFALRGRRRRPRDPGRGQAMEERPQRARVRRVDRERLAGARSASAGLARTFSYTLASAKRAVRRGPESWLRWTTASSASTASGQLRCAMQSSARVRRRGRGTGPLRERVASHRPRRPDRRARPARPARSLTRASRPLRPIAPARARAGTSRSGALPGRPPAGARREPPDGCDGVGVRVERFLEERSRARPAIGAGPRRSSSSVPRRSSAASKR